VDTLEGSAHPNMKELRPRATRGGAHWTKWYATNIPIADRLFSAHQEKLMKEAGAAKAAKPTTRKRKKR